MSAPYPTNPPPYPGPPQQGPQYPGPPHPGPPGPVMNQPSATYVVYPGQTTLIQGPTVVPVMIQNQMGYEPCSYTCKSCNIQTRTRVERNPSCRTHLFAGMLCLVGCWPFVCLPYCINACNNADHYCSNCGSYIGSYTG